MTFPPSPWIYIAGPLFTQGEIAFNQTLAERLRTAGYAIYLPQEMCAGITEPQKLFARCIQGLDGACLVLIILDGTDADSGSCFEAGYAYAKGVPIVGLRTDFRGSGEHMGINLMLTHSCTRLLLTQTIAVNTENPAIATLEMGEDYTPKLFTILEQLPEAQRARRQI